MATEFSLLQTRLHLAQREGPFVRSDGRELNERRPTAVNIGSISTADGSAVVKIGCTSIVCGIKAELAEPTVDEPKKGFIVPNVDLFPICSPMFKMGPPSEHAQVLSKMMLDMLNSSGCIDLERLCIVEGKLSWCLYVDLTCLDYDGNVAEACIMAATAALANLTLPKVATEGEEINVLWEREQAGIQHGPLAATFAILADDIVVVDPTHEEECLAKEVFTIALTHDGKVCMTHIPGGSVLSLSAVENYVEQSHQLVKDTRLLLDRSLSNLESCG
ncbi:exosome complex component RRP43-like [Ornithodoros turicata]|uniref:exosome complex component RRP43-like n=1 Tax=Ornithodoros turicata TaxID=34597 RepID=UPI00313A3F10